AAADLLAFLGADEQVHKLAEELASAAPSVEPSPPLGLPFRPAGFRDCSLWEEHLIAAGRGGLRLRESAARLVSGGFERLARRPFPAPGAPPPLVRAAAVLQGEPGGVHRRRGHRALARVRAGPRL